MDFTQIDFKLFFSSICNYLKTEKAFIFFFLPLFFTLKRKVFRGNDNYKNNVLKRFFSFEMVANGWNEQFNTNLGKIQYYLDFILIFFINRDKEEKTKNGYLTAAKLDLIQKNQCHIRNQWPRFTQNQVSNLLHSWKSQIL